MEKLRSMDDAFRRQMEAVQVSHQAELLQLASDKQKDVEMAKQRVTVATGRFTFNTGKWTPLINCKHTTLTCIMFLE